MEKKRGGKRTFRNNILSPFDLFVSLDERREMMIMGRWSAYLHSLSGCSSPHKLWSLRLFQCKPSASKREGWWRQLRGRIEDIVWRVLDFHPYNFILYLSPLCLHFLSSYSSSTSLPLVEMDEEELNIDRNLIWLERQRAESGSEWEGENITRIWKVNQVSREYSRRKIFSRKWTERRMKERKKEQILAPSSSSFHFQHFPLLFIVFLWSAEWRRKHDLKRRILLWD